MNPSNLKALKVKLSSKLYIDLARSLTLLYCLLLLSSCSITQMANPYDLEQCKTHAYLHLPLDLYLTQRFPRNSPVRVGIVPFSSAANIASKNDQSPGIGNQLAYKVRDLLLSHGVIPIVEIIPRDDWPRKYDEFYAGNYGAIEMARRAHYDLVLVGMLESTDSLESLAAHTKLIEVYNGITVWSGRSYVETLRNRREKTEPYSWFLTRNPNKIYTNMLIDELSYCIVDGILAEEQIP